MNNKALHTLSYGVYVISTWDKERPTGCIANSTMQITSDPATIAISINHDNYTKQCIEEDGRFAISILPENCDPSIIGTFGFKSGKNVDKFDTVAYELKGNLPIIQEACAYITCSVVNRMETDTHTVFLGKVYDADILTENEPMTYSYYHKVIKGKSPKNAPTYVAEEMSENIKPQKYICSVCNYEYSGDIPFEELPDDYTCPICGLPKTVFRKYE